MARIRHKLNPGLKTIVLSLIFGLCFFLCGFASMFIANMLTPNAKGVLSIQTESFLPLLHAVLVGLAVLFRAPTSLCFFSILSALSVILFLKRRSLILRIAIPCLALSCLIFSSLWVPNPIVRWPISILGEHDDRQLIRELFPIHVVNPNWIRTKDDSLIYLWAFAEIMARGAVVAGVWCIGLIAIAKLSKENGTANKTLESIDASRAEDSV